ncbi:MAG: ABC transporter permease [Oscillospiraceae bacterium]|nr:ABC transporter permease [Oscillospiraceae bacterium]
MNIRENISIAVFSIRTNLMRSALTMLGIIIGVSSVIAIITVGNGGRDFIISQIRDMGSSMVTVSVDPAMDASAYITRDDIRDIKLMENVQFVSPQVMSFGGVKTAYNEGIGMAISGNPDLRYISSVDVIAGHYFTEEEYNSAARVCLITKIGAQTMFGRSNVVGQGLDFTMNGQAIHLRIIGVIDLMSAMGGMDMDDMSEMAESNGFSMGMGSDFCILIMPATVTDMLLDSDGAYDNISIMATDESYLDVVGNAAANLLYTRHGNAGSNAYSVVNMATYIDLLDSVINILTTFIAGVSAISLLVGGIGVMNIMLVSVTERTREIGIRKALGARTATILFQFLTESVILCLIGGTIGFILGVSGAALVAYLMGIPIAMRFSTIAIAVGFSSAIGLFFGIYPARRAAMMLPIDALRRE